MTSELYFVGKNISSLFCSRLGEDISPLGVSLGVSLTLQVWETENTLLKVTPESLYPRVHNSCLAHVL